MRFPHLFEFMDLEWLPGSLRGTLREILECGNGRPFRSYYDWVCDQVIEAATAAEVEMIVELGAGTAPLTRRLAEDNRATRFKLVPCDLNPDLPAYAALAQKYRDHVVPLVEPLDFSRRHPWPARTLLVLSATLHHVPQEVRDRVLQTLAGSADRVLVFEPLRKHPASLLFVVGSLVPAVVLPLWMVRRRGRLRRIAWCWLLPIAPLMFLWDGWISCFRQWTRAEWMACVPSGATVSSTLFCQMVAIWRATPRRGSGVTG